MIKALVRTKADGASVVILGFSRPETELLHDGVPVAVNLPLVDPRLPDLTIVVMAGESDEALVAEVNGTAGRRIVSL